MMERNAVGSGRVRATTILCVRVGGEVAMAGDGQVTMGETIVKARSSKLRTMRDGRILAGFAGGVADALTLFEKFEAQLERHPRNLARAAVELAKEWRSDRYLRRLEAVLAVADRESSLMVAGTGRGHRTGRRDPRPRLRWAIRARRRPRPGTRDRSLGCRSGAAGARDRGGDLRVYERRDHGCRTGGQPGERHMKTDISPVPPPGEARIADALTPRQIVEELDQYIIGQDEAKKAVAIALRNRWRRQHVDEGMREEILPNNIILIGPTGVGKTEIARRLSRLAGAPFIKVEASKFTEVGYVGRDVESMIRDLVEVAINVIRDEQEARHGEIAEQRVEERLLDLLLPPVAEGEPEPAPGEERRFVVSLSGQTSESPYVGPSDQRKRRTREKLRALLRDGALDEREVEVEVSESSIPMLDVGGGMEGLDFNVGEVLKGMLPRKTRRRLVSVAEARRILHSEEIANLNRYGGSDREGPPPNREPRHRVSRRDRQGRRKARRCGA